MKRLIIYTLTALCATIALSMASPDKAALEAKENTAWQAFKDKKADDFKKKGEWHAVFHSDMKAEAPAR